MSTASVQAAAQGALARHWDTAYETRGTRGVSWFQPNPRVALELIAEVGAAGRRVVDVGGGASNLARELAARGSDEVWVLDVSQAALSASAGHLPEAVRLVAQNVLDWKPDRIFDLWHDRACFHFLVDADDRDEYLRTMRAAVVDDGLVVIATFAEDGPRTCSSLPVVGYSADELAGTLGLEVLASRREEHLTPNGTLQPFTWVAGRITPHARNGSAGSGRRSLDDLLTAARVRIRHLEPQAAQQAIARGALLVDIRPACDRVRDGVVPGSVHVPRTVLEWRLDPSSPWANPHLCCLEREIILLCDHGCSSTLAAGVLVDLGFRDAGDVAGGFLAWREAGLPIAPAPDHTLAPGELVGMRKPEPA